jgi:hypothetical protein
VLYVRRLVPHLAKGIRAGLLLASVEPTDVVDAPGLVFVAADGRALAATLHRADAAAIGHPG